jgi:basic membrane protein A
MRFKARALLAASAALTLAVMVAACGGDDDSDDGTAATDGDEPIKVGAALIGPKNDKSFNQAAFEGIEAAVAANPNMELTATLENNETDQERTDAIETLAPNNDVVVAVSASFGPILDVEAPKFPDTYFIDISGATGTFQENVTGFANDWGAPAFVGGAIAATLNETGTVGYVGGAEIPPTTQGAAAFAAGVELIDSDIEVLSNIIGSFDDVAKAKQATAAMLSDGADVIMPFLDSGIAGSYAAGADEGSAAGMFKLTIVDCESYDNTIGTEVVNNKSATERLLTDWAAGTLEPGAIFLDLQEPDLQTLELCPAYAEMEEIAAVTQETIEGVNSGDIVLPPDAVNPRPDYPYKEGFDGETINAAE